LLETKLLLSSTISEAKQGARFMSADIKDFFLRSSINEPEYMKIHSRYYLEDIRQEYNIEPLIAEDGHDYVKIKGGMYGRKQAAILAYKQLATNLELHGYYPFPNTTGLWKHKTRRTIFWLCVNDFGIKYYNDNDKNHLLTALKHFYKVSMDNEGRNYCGLTLNWNYEAGYVDIAMPGYIKDLLKRLQHPTPCKAQYAPHRWTVPTYGSRLQMAPNKDTSDPLDSIGIRKAQSIVGSLLYYARAINKMLSDI